MTMDPLPGFRGELIAALDVLAPQIDGLGDLSIASISPEARAVINDSLTGRRRRRDLIIAVIAAMDAVVMLWNKLKDDSYPAMPPIVIPINSLFEELKKETDAIAIAMKIFAGPAPAARMEFILGGITKKEP